VKPIAPLTKLETSEAKVNAQEQMQLEIINSTKKRKIIVLKKKEPVQSAAVQSAAVQSAAVQSAAVQSAATEKVEENNV
jgi:hypothetical protein